MKINYDKLFNPYNVEIKEDVSDIDAIIEYEEIMYAISEYIINYRKKHNLTQKQLAEKINKKQSMISKLESGEYNPSFIEIYNLLLTIVEGTSKIPIRLLYINQIEKDAIISNLNFCFILFSQIL